MSTQASTPVWLYAEVPHFYAAVERAHDPSLQNRPLIVGGDPRKRGRVQSATPELVRSGVTQGMPMQDALELCPEALAVPTNMQRYRGASTRLHGAMRKLIPEIEPVGLPGAFLELNESSPDSDAVRELALALCGRVAQDLGLTLRVGAGSNRMLARLAAEEAAEGEIHCVASSDEKEFLASHSPDRLPEVGPKTMSILRSMGVTSIAELLALGRDRLEHELGNHGRRIFEIADGRHEEPVRRTGPPKSQSHEMRFSQPQTKRAELEEHLRSLCQRAESKLRHLDLAAARVAIKLRYDDQQTTTRTRTLARPIGVAAEIYAIASRLLDRTQPGQRPVILLGLTVSELVLPRSEMDRQLDLFPDPH